MICSLAATAQTEFRTLSHDEAVKAALKENKLLFIDFYTTWCGPCKMMTKNVFPQKEVGDYFNHTFVCIKLDAEKEDEGKPYLQTYHVAAYPTFVVIDPKSNKVLYNKAGGNFDGNAFIEQIKVGITPDLSPERVAERYHSGERTPEVVQAYANNKVEQSKFIRDSKERLAKLAEATATIDEYWNTLSDAQRLSADNAFCYNTVYLGQKTSSPKITFAMEHREDFDAETLNYINRQIESFVDNIVMNYLSGNTADTDEKIESIQHFITQNRLDPKGKYDTAYKLIKAHEQGDESHYIDVCEKNFADLDEIQQQRLLMSFSELITSHDKSIVQKADRFMRKQFMTVDATTIYFASMSLMQFQKRMEDSAIE